MLGGPESANYVDEYLSAGADIVVIGEGEVTAAELLPALARSGPHPAAPGSPGIAFRDETGTARAHPRTV